MMEAEQEGRLHGAPHPFEHDLPFIPKAVEKLAEETAVLSITAGLKSWDEKFDAMNVYEIAEAFNEIGRKYAETLGSTVSLDPVFDETISVFRHSNQPDLDANQRASGLIGAAPGLVKLLRRRKALHEEEIERLNGSVRRHTAMGGPRAALVALRQVVETYKKEVLSSEADIEMVQQGYDYCVRDAMQGQE